MRQFESAKAFYFAILQLLYLPELHLALQISASELEGRFKNVIEKLILLGLGASSYQI